MKETGREQSSLESCNKAILGLMTNDDDDQGEERTIFIRDQVGS
jgi:hypothetical protein